MNASSLRIPGTVRAALILYVINIVFGLAMSAYSYTTMDVLKNTPQLSIPILVILSCVSLLFNLFILFCIIKAYGWMRTVLALFVYLSIPMSVYCLYMSITANFMQMLLLIYSKPLLTLMGYFMFIGLLINLAIVILLYLKPSSAWYRAMDEYRRYQKYYPQIR